MSDVSASVPGLEPAFDVRVELGPLDAYGTTRAGHRRVIPILSGSHHRGALLTCESRDCAPGPASVLDALLRGDEVDPSKYYFGTNIAIETSAVRCAHLQDCLFVASCVREADASATPPTA